MRPPAAERVVSHHISVRIDSICTSDQFNTSKTRGRTTLEETLLALHQPSPTRVRFCSNARIVMNIFVCNDLNTCINQIQTHKRHKTTRSVAGSLIWCWGVDFPRLLTGSIYLYQKMRRFSGISLH